MSAEDGSSSSPGAIIGVIVAVTLFALGIGYLLFQRGLKKKQEKAREVKVTHLATRHVGDEDFYLDEVDEKISKDVKEKSKSKDMIGGMTKKKLDKGVAEKSGTGSEHLEHDKEALLEVNKEDIDDYEFDKIAESVAVATRTKKRRQANITNKLKSSLTKKRRNNPIATRLKASLKLKASLTNTAPKIISMEFDESSDDESSSSSEEEEEEEDSSSSSDSDSSSSSEGSESSSQIKARKRREKRIAADKKKSTSMKDKKPSTRPRRSHAKQRQRPSRPSRSNNIV